MLATGKHKNKKSLVARALERLDEREREAVRKWWRVQKLLAAEDRVERARQRRKCTVF
jgi:hypothetical protein